jgi:hypothetical protein
MLHAILKEMAVKGELLAEIRTQALRSGLIGAFEGLLRDRLLPRPSRFPASYMEADAQSRISRI